VTTKLQIKPGDVVFIWPRIQVTVQAIDKSGVSVIWWNEKTGEYVRKIVDEMKILGKRQ
jgi:hypothetical protein